MVRRLLYCLSAWGFLVALLLFSAFGEDSVTARSARPPINSGRHASGKGQHKKKTKPRSARVRKIHQAFVASTTLRPMARQLLEERTPAAYAGVEAYASKHGAGEVGALAWLVVGYAHLLDHDYVKAIDPLNRAKLHAGELVDYVTYYLGNAYFEAGRSAEAAATLQGFSRKYPDSLLRRDAEVTEATALISEGRSEEAVELLESNRQPTRVDVEWNLGRAYENLGESAKAAAIFRRIYLTLPLSGEAEMAEQEMKKLASFVEPPNFEERSTRADLLVKGKRYSDAATEYRQLADEANPGQRPQILLDLANSLLKSGKSKDAKHVLESLTVPSGEPEAQRLYLLGEVARSNDDEDGFLRILSELRQRAPSSPWLDQCLLSAANVFLLRKDYEGSIELFRELQQRFPMSPHASYAHWKAAWLTLRQGRREEAKKLFEEQIAWYPAGNEVPAALYWRARLAEDDGQSGQARAFYRKLSERFRNYYYAELARQEWNKLPAAAQALDFPLLNRIPPLEAGQKIEEDPPPPDNVRLEKAQLLGNGGLVALAARELQAAAQEERGAWAAPETARLYRENEQYNLGIEVMKKAVPNYFAMDIPALPRSYWESLFPRPSYWNDLKRYSTRNALDPFLVASLIRQESEFNVGAVSHKNAVGLMQLLPKTGKSVAKEEKLRHFKPNQLFVPAVNLELGTRYFRDMVDKFGAFEYALAAYNAGSDRVQDWLSAGKFRDPQEFVESIPFTETREYVQAILRNANVYRQLYETP